MGEFFLLKQIAVWLLPPRESSIPRPADFFVIFIMIFFFFFYSHFCAHLAVLNRLFALSQGCTQLYGHSEWSVASSTFEQRPYPLSPAGHVRAMSSRSDSLARSRFRTCCSFVIIIVSQNAQTAGHLACVAIRYSHTRLTIKSFQVPCESDIFRNLSFFFRVIRSVSVYLVIFTFFTFRRKSKLICLRNCSIRKIAI